MNRKTDLYFIFDGSYSAKDYGEMLNQLYRQIISILSLEINVSYDDVYITCLVFNGEFSTEKNVLIDHIKISDISNDMIPVIEIDGSTDPCDALKYAVSSGIKRYNKWKTSNIPCNKPQYFFFSDGFLDFGAYPNRVRDEAGQLNLLNSFFESAEYIRFLEKNNALSFYVYGFDSNTKQAHTGVLSLLTAYPEKHYIHRLVKSFLTDLSCIVEPVKESIN